MNKPLHVGVVIVSYKTANLTVEALSSVASERNASSSIVIRAMVVDNASGDTPVVQQAIDDYGWASWAQVYTSEVNGGFGFGNNLGFKQLSLMGELDYVYFLNPDARCTEGAIQALVNHLNTHAHAGIVGSSFFNGDGSVWPIAFGFPTLLGELDTGFKIGVISRLLKPWLIAKTMTQLSQPIDWVAGASMMMRASLMQALGGFDESFFLYYEETDLCYRAKQLGFETWYVPQSKVIHIAGQSTKVTEREVVRKRFPPYWYESRSLYYFKHYGFLYSFIADVSVVLATALGNLRLLCLGRQHDTPTHFARDIFSNSALYGRIRKRKSFRSMLS